MIPTRHLGGGWNEIEIRQPLLLEQLSCLLGHLEQSGIFADEQPPCVFRLAHHVDGVRRIQVICHLHRLEFACHPTSDDPTRGRVVSGHAQKMVADVADNVGMVHQPLPHGKRFVP